MTESLKRRLKAKMCSLMAIAAGAFALAAILSIFFFVVYILLPAHIQEPLKSGIFSALQDPRALREWLTQKGQDSAWLFVALQVAQVFFAPIPGQAAALAGGYLFGFGKGWWLTTLGLFLGSALAMCTARLLGEKFVRKVISSEISSRFDDLISKGGYAQFFIIFLLPALPDDAVCFIAGLTRLRLVPLTLVCLVGRAPGMAVLSLIGSQAATGLIWQVKLLFVAAIMISAVIWMFDDIILNTLKRK